VKCPARPVANHDGAAGVLDQELVVTFAEVVGHANKVAAAAQA
jgi:hypothetical protein